MAYFVAVDPTLLRPGHVWPWTTVFAAREAAWAAGPHRRTTRTHLALSRVHCKLR
jgi:hypothetical protein